VTALVFVPGGRYAELAEVGWSNTMDTLADHQGRLEDTRCNSVTQSNNQKLDKLVGSLR